MVQWIECHYSVPLCTNKSLHSFKGSQTWTWLTQRKVGNDKTLDAADPGSPALVDRQHA